jgi:hypothetical protein
MTLARDLGSSRPIRLDLTILIIFDEEYKLWRLFSNALYARLYSIILLHRIKSQITGAFLKVQLSVVLVDPTLSLL